MIDKVLHYNFVILVYMRSPVYDSSLSICSHYFKFLHDLLIVTLNVLHDGIIRKSLGNRYGRDRPRLFQSNWPIDRAPCFNTLLC